MWGLECLWLIFMIKQSRCISYTKAGWVEKIRYANRLQCCHVLIEKNHLEFYQEKEASYFQVRIFIILQYSSNMLESLASLPIEAHISLIIAKFCVCILVNLVFSHSLFFLSFYCFMHMYFQFLTGPWVA